LFFAAKQRFFSAIPILISLTFVPIHPSPISHGLALQPTEAKNDSASAGYGMEGDGSAKPLTIDP
jgi:hypothetical protein